MSFKTRILALATSAALMLSPCTSVAEGMGFYAGELTPGVIADSYTAGKQINATVTFDVQTGALTDEKALAAQRLLEQCRVQLSFYDDFGTGRVRANVTLGEATLLTADTMIFADGSVQAMTSLTGKYVLALPAGAFVDGRLDMSVLSEEQAYVSGTEEFNALSANKRFEITMNEMGTLLFQHLLGWVSIMQMNSDGRLYTFDDTYLEATQTRDAVSQRMIGKVEASEFIELFCNVFNTINDESASFQQALADVLAQAGVTRWQMRDLADGLFTEETIDPALDFVQTTWSVKQGDPNALCEYDDVSYLLNKVVKSIDHIWENETDEYLDLIVSYDDFGKTVGLDAHLPLVSTVLPYEGDFTYSLKTDEYWQERHTAHGEFQIYDGNRIIGDITMVKGQDVDGVNESSLTGALNVVNTESGDKTGFDISGVLTSALDTASGAGETITGSASLSVNGGGQSAHVLSASVNAKTEAEGDGFKLTGTAGVSLSQGLGIVMNVEVASGEYDEQPFAGGPALELKALDEQMSATLEAEFTSAMVTLFASLAQQPDVLTDALRLVGD